MRNAPACKKPIRRSRCWCSGRRAPPATSRPGHANRAVTARGGRFFLGASGPRGSRPASAVGGPAGYPGRYKMSVRRTKFCAPSHLRRLVKDSVLKEQRPAHAQHNALPQLDEISLSPIEAFVQVEHQGDETAHALGQLDDGVPVCSVALAGPVAVQSQARVGAQECHARQFRGHMAGDSLQQARGFLCVVPHHARVVAGGKVDNHPVLASNRCYLGVARGMYPSHSSGESASSTVHGSGCDRPRCPAYMSRSGT